MTAKTLLAKGSGAGHTRDSLAAEVPNCADFIFSIDKIKMSFAGLISGLTPPSMISEVIGPQGADGSDFLLASP